MKSKLSSKKTRIRSIVSIANLYYDPRRDEWFYGLDVLFSDGTGVYRSGYRSKKWWAKQALHDLHKELRWKQ